MDSATESLASSVERNRKELHTALESGEVAYSSLELLLANYRSASETLVFHDLALAASEEIEVILWTYHGKVNRVFREDLARFKFQEGKKKVVERRKLEKLYERFIKSSQSFYRGLIQHLASHFTNVDEVLEAARKVKSDTLSVDQPVAASAAQKQLVLHSCHANLVRLGDLSRYRETELKHIDRNWGPAEGYYRHAIAVLPTSGEPYNQLAVISRTNQERLRTVYYLYRALLAQNSSRNAQDNLATEFKKIRSLWAKPENHSANNGIFTHFQSRFAAFQAKCYSGVEFEEHRDLETEMLHEITVALLQKPDADLLNKICLINIAAEAAALERLSHEDHEHLLHAFHLRQSFNVKLFSQLLQKLVTELQKIKKLVASSELGENEIFTTGVRCLLPILRQYSSWLLAEVPLLGSLNTKAKVPTASSFQVALAGQVQELWLVYVDALAALASTYPLKGGTTLKYLLAEDEDALGFKPFTNNLLVNKSRFLDEAGSIRPRCSDTNARNQEPEEEMLHRVRGIVKEGMAIAKSMDPERMVPVRLKEGRFVYLEPELSLTVPKINGQLLELQSLSSFPDASEQSLAAQGHDATSIFMDTEMRDMVDNLLEEKHPRSTGPVGPQSDDAGGGSGRKATFTAADLVRQIQRPSQSPSAQSYKRSVNLSTESSPFPSGLQDSAIRPGSARTTQSFKTPTSPPHDSSGHSFTNLMIRQREQIQSRSSPQQSRSQPSSWPVNYESPTGVKPMFNQRSPPWLNPSTPLQTGDEEVKKPLPRRNLFGAIGENPGRTPTSAQPG